MKIFIYVEGGMVQGVRATEPCEVVVWDQDNIENGDDIPLEGIDEEAEFEEIFKEINVRYPEAVW